MPVIEALVYNKHRDKVMLFETYSNRFVLPKLEFLENNVHFIDAIKNYLEYEFDLKTNFERVLLVQFDLKENEFIIAVVLKELEEENPNNTYFSLDFLPPNMLESDMRVLRAEMQDVTYEIPERC